MLTHKSFRFLLRSACRCKINNFIMQNQIFEVNAAENLPLRTQNNRLLLYWHRATVSCVLAKGLDLFGIMNTFHLSLLVAGQVNRLFVFAPEPAFPAYFLSADGMHSSDNVEFFILLIQHERILSLSAKTLNWPYSLRGKILRH